MSESLAWQPSLTEASPSLFSTSFCVLDLETTGVGGESAITEIGAVVVRGGEVEKKFQSLVNPGIRIDPMITAITGITNEMVAEAPGIASVLPSFLEFAKNSVWVAHNARFDIGFLKR
ncbi:MAG: endonuclease, partial [Propionibacteriales bacterium]